MSHLHDSAGLPPAVAMDDARRRRGLLFLGLAVAGVAFTMAIQTGMNSNFLKEEIGVSGGGLGLLEPARESCGIISFGVLALLAGFAEPILGMLMLFLVAGGLSAYALAGLTPVPPFWWVLIFSMVWSQGLHVWMPLPNSIALSLAEPNQAGRRLGQIQAAGALGAALGLAVAIGLTFVHVPMRPLYLVAGATAVLAGLACLGIPRDLKTPGPRLVFRRRYGLYYMLCFLDGWRKQIFLSFATFMLVETRHAPLVTILVLWLIVQPVQYFVSPRIGRLIDRIGEKKVLTFYYTAVMPVCFGYAFLPSLLPSPPAVGSGPVALLSREWWAYGDWVLYALFLGDSMLSTLTLGLTTYVNRIAPPHEHTPTLSMGVAVNHIASVSMPLLGGMLWAVCGYRYTFLLGAIGGLLGVVAVRYVPVHRPAGAPAVPLAKAAE